MSYDYRPLQQDEIRLLTIQPIDDDAEPDLPVSCVLKHVRLTPPPNETLYRMGYKGAGHVWPELCHIGDRASLFKDSSFDFSTESTQHARYDSGMDIDHDWKTDDQNLPWRHDWGDYIAMSYVWGRSDLKRSIILDGQTVEVRSNLYDALVQLRRSQRVREGFQVWIDAVCIDQRNDKEREQQITRMHDIYDSAWQVLIWLGASADGSDMAITALRWIADRSRRPNPLDGFYQTSAAIDLHPLLVKWPTYRSPFRREVYRALFHLLTRPYWRRMWILQEVAMAREDAPVICGNACLPWGQLYEAAQLIKSDEQRLGQRILRGNGPRLYPGWVFEVGRDRMLKSELGWSSERMWGLLLEMTCVQREQKSEQPTDSVSPSVMRPLLLARDALLTKDEDRVYGILGIKALADSVTIVPDYGLGIEPIYREFTAEMILGGYLDILRLVSRNAIQMHTADGVPGRTYKLSLGRKQARYTMGEPCIHDLPSWTVCWICKPAPVAQLRGLYCASGAPPFSGTKFLSDSIMLTQGLVIDTISSLGAFHGAELDSSYPISDDNQNRRSAYGSIELTREALWRTIVGNTTKEGGVKAPDSYSWLLNPKLWRQGIAGVYTNGFGLSELMKRNKTLTICGYTLEYIIFGDRGVQSWRQSQAYNATREQREALEWAVNATAWRRLAGTEGGRMGLTPAATTLGDRIAVISGCSVPMVLRRSGAGWTIVGECYVQGVMNGEALEAGDELGNLRIY